MHIGPIYGCAEPLYLGSTLFEALVVRKELNLADAELSKAVSPLWMVRSGQ